MTIQILPARLANQIAAGEVVERPASVVKELVENSLDSGATRIDIDIEKGGTKLIRVRDNGHGIDKDELILALSRHATSKIHTLDDLEAIVSLGFRGEALASISSVSRLTLTSRPATQQQAWLAYSEGRDMAVKLEPTAHPIGSTVEVLDLFFNTPARRKFLRTDKTEFTHIDELIKRIALSRFDVSITLRHNGSVVRQYRASKTDIQIEKRISAACGAGFVRHMLQVKLEHQGLKLYGWISDPNGARQQSDLQYCYVNGRMMKDKLLNHAIRQSYESSLRADQYPAYVLYIELDPHEVDVNVHPAKHEVRFHQARLVHDFIYQALTSALAEANYIEQPGHNAAAFYQPMPETEEPSLPPMADNTPAYPSKAASHTPEMHDQIAEQSRPHQWRESPQVNNQPLRNDYQAEKPPSKREVTAYQQLMQVPESIQAAEHKPEVTPISALSENEMVQGIGKAVAVVEGKYLLTQSKPSPCLVSLDRAQWLRVRKQLDYADAPLVAQPLLVPLAFSINPQEQECLSWLTERLSAHGIELKLRPNHKVMVMGVPQPLRQQNLQQLLPDLISYAASLPADDHSQIDEMLSDWLAGHVVVRKSDYTLSEAIQLIAELEQLWQGKLPLDDRKFIQRVDFSATIAALL